MHIIAGEFRRQKVLTPKGDITRPTSGRLRETVFNICQGYIQESNFLDICAGSGAMGLEAISRGARRATFIDDNLLAIRAIQDNIKQCKATERSQVIHKDAIKALVELEAEGAFFDICYLDPPYHQPELLRQIIEFLDQSTLLAEGAMLFIEDSANSLINGLVLNRLALVSKRQAGDTILYLFNS